MADQQYREQDLLQACCNDNVNTVQRCLNAGNIKIYCRNRHGFTPLHHASIGGLAHIAQRLIDNGADVNCRDNFEFWKDTIILGVCKSLRRLCSSLAVEWCRRAQRSKEGIKSTSRSLHN